MSRFFTAILALAILHTGSAVDSSKQNKITVDLYYETLCPYSVLFVTNQLLPAYANLKDYVTVNFVPFGHSKCTVGESSTKCTCQHGPKECHGNRAQACALYEIQRTFKLDDQQDKAVDLVGCVMGNKSPSSAMPECAQKTGFSKASIQNVKSCINGDLGDWLILAYMEKTKAFESPLKGVPAVAINGVKNEKAVADFAGLICQLIPDTEKPALCGQS